MTPEVGVVGTPVIDPAGAILYVVSKSVSSGGSFYQRLHAIDLTTGSEKSGSPVVIAASYPGAGGTNVTFSARQENQRPGLGLVNGTVYIAWGSHEDSTPYYGWLAAYTYNGTTGFTLSSALNVTPNTGEGGIWMSGGAPSADGNGNLYVITSNGTFDVTHATAPNNDYGDSFLQLNSALVVSSWFTPSDQASDAASNNDFGAGGSAVVLNVNAAPLPHLVVGGGKDGFLYLLNGDNMGGSGDSSARQYFSVGNPIFATAAFWNNSLYLAPVGASMLAYAFNTSTNLFNTTATSQSATAYGFAGSSPSVSASGASSNGVLWGLDTGSYCTNQANSCGPAVLHAYNARNLASELWNSSMIAADAAGYAVKFTVPTVANGKVYIGTRGNNIGGAFGSTTISGELDVYGLKPN
jgi:hypothetical protein